MGQICSICGFRVKPQQATAHVETSLRDIQASHQWQQPMTTNGSSSANAPFFLYTEGAIVPGDVTHVRVDHSVMVIPTRAFAGLLQLKVVVLPEVLQEFGVLAFWHCISLERINFPPTLTVNGHAVIGHYAFCYCISLREVDLSNVKKLGGMHS